MGSLKVTQVFLAALKNCAVQHHRLFISPGFSDAKTSLLSFRVNQLDRSGASLPPQDDRCLLLGTAERRGHCYLAVAQRCPLLKVGVPYRYEGGTGGRERGMEGGRRAVSGAAEGSLPSFLPCYLPLSHTGNLAINQAIMKPL